MPREAFLLYGKFQEPIMRLSNESKGMLLTALFEYHNTGREIELPMDVQMAFLFIKNQMDLDAKKYKDKCDVRAEAGRKSAAARAKKQEKKSVKSSNANKNEQSSTNATNVKFDEQTQQKDPDNDNENDNEKDVVVDNNNTKTTTPTTSLNHKFYVPGRTDAECRAALIEARKLPIARLREMADGVPRDYDAIKMQEIWQFDREMDIAVGYRVLLERKALLAKLQKREG